MSNLHSQLGYSTREFQALQLIGLALFDVGDFVSGINRLLPMFHTVIYIFYMVMISRYQ